MTTRTDKELERIATADELDIAPQRSDGSMRRPTTIWVVRDGASCSSAPGAAAAERGTAPPSPVTPAASAPAA